MKKYSYAEFTDIMSAYANKSLENQALPVLKGYIVFSDTNWNKGYSLESRTYEVQSDANYYSSNKIGCSLFGCSLDLQDIGVRLDHYIHEEHWAVEYCYFKEEIS